MSKEPPVKEEKTEKPEKPRHHSKAWGDALVDACVEGRGVARVVVGMARDGEFFCALLSHTEEVARGSSKESMAEAVDKCLAAWELWKAARGED